MGVIQAARAQGTERDLRQLRFAEQFTVWAIRAWTRNAQSHGEEAIALDTGFKLAKISPALTDLSMFMRVLQCAAVRPIEIRCIHCPTLSADEEALLEAAACLQSNFVATAHRLLHRALPCSAARAALWALDAFARRLRDGGLHLPLDDAFDDVAEQSERRLAPPQRLH